MFSRIVSGLAAAALLGSGAVAQEQQWTYVGPADLFESADDFPFAQACITHGWTPANSGAPAIAKQWAPLDFETVLEMQQAAAGGHCDIAAFPTSAITQQPDLISSMGLDDMTAALTAAGGGASETGLPDNAAEIAARVESSCDLHSYRRIAADCACLGGLALEGLENGRFAAPSNDVNGAALTITNTLLHNGVVPEACINEAGLAEHMAKQADMRIQSPMSQTDPAYTDPDGFKSCVVAEGLARFRAEPTLSYLGRSLLSDALVACDKL